MLNNNKTNLKFCCIYNFISKLCTKDTNVQNTNESLDLNKIFELLVTDTKYLFNYQIIE